jgi:hypothetical protein
MKKVERKKTGIIFNAGLHIDFESVLKSLKTVKSKKIYFDLLPNCAIEIVEIIEREETQEEIKAREDRENQIKQKYEKTNK